MSARDKLQAFSTDELIAELARRKRDSHLLGPLELDVLDSLARRSFTARRLAEELGRTHQHMCDVLARLRIKGFVLTDGAYHSAWHSLTDKGARRLRAELRRGRQPGVAARSVGRDEWAPMTPEVSDG